MTRYEDAIGKINREAIKKILEAETFEDMLVARYMPTKQRIKSLKKVRETLQYGLTPEIMAFDTRRTRKLEWIYGLIEVNEHVLDTINAIKKRRLNDIEEEYKIRHARHKATGHKEGRRFPFCGGDSE